MIKRYCEIHGIDYQYKVRIDEYGNQDLAIAIFDNWFVYSCGLFVLGEKIEHKDEVDYLKKIESYFIKQGKKQDKLLKSKTVAYYSLKDCKWKIKIYGDILQCASISCKVSKKNNVKTSVDYGDYILTKESK